MSKILLCYFDKINNFYQGVADSLSGMGCDIVLFNLANYLEYEYWGTVCSFNNEGKKIYNTRIKQQKFDAVFSFNNVAPVEIIEDNVGKIFLLDADNPKFFWNKDYLKNNIDLFIFLGFQRNSLQMYQDAFNINSKKYFFFSAATSINRKKLKQNTNISFIGNNFLINAFDCMKELYEIKYFHIIQFLFTENVSCFFHDDIAIYKKYKSKFPRGVKEDFDNVCRLLFFENHYLSGFSRVNLLTQVSDLGLQIYGHGDWINLISTHPDVACCYIEKEVFEKVELEKIYNSSKISLNSSHYQAVSGFSWRVMDIMASNSCIMMEAKEDWDYLFGKYISDEVKNAITYKDKHDIRKKVTTLLENEKLRLQCVKECNDAIKKNGRWSHRFKKLEKKFNLNLFNKQKKGKIIRYDGKIKVGLVNNSTNSQVGIWKFHLKEFLKAILPVRIKDFLIKINNKLKIL